MEYIDFSVQTIAITVIASLALALNIVLWRKLVKMQSIYDRELKHSQKELQLITQTHIGMGKKFLEMEKQLKRLLTQQSLLHAQTNNKEPSESKQKPSIEAERAAEQTTKAENQGSYNNAVNLFKQGYSAEEVAARCGLSKAETSLMALVNREFISEK